MIPTPGKDIIAAVARDHGLAPDDLTRRFGPHSVRPVRTLAMRRIRDELGYSYPKIGRLFGRNHASIIWALQGGRGRHRA
jgi:chromosomal replication initiation ATPase DnaA